MRSFARSLAFGLLLLGFASSAFAYDLPETVLSNQPANTTKYQDVQSQRQLEILQAQLNDARIQQHLADSSSSSSASVNDAATTTGTSDSSSSVDTHNAAGSTDQVLTVDKATGRAIARFLKDRQAALAASLNVTLHGDAPMTDDTTVADTTPITKRPLAPSGPGDIALALGVLGALCLTLWRVKMVEGSWEERM